MHGALLEDYKTNASDQRLFTEQLELHTQISSSFLVSWKVSIIPSVFIHDTITV